MKMARRDFLNVSTAAAVVCAAALLPVEKAAAAQQTMAAQELLEQAYLCLLYTSPSPRDA